MRQSVEDVKRLVSIVGDSLEFASVREDFGQLVVCIEARQLNDGMVSSLQQFAQGVSSRKGADKASDASVDIETDSRRVYYMPPERDNGMVVEFKQFRDELKNAGIRVSTWK